MEKAENVGKHESSSMNCLLDGKNKLISLLCTILGVQIVRIQSNSM